MYRLMWDDKVLAEPDKIGEDAKLILKDYVPDWVVPNDLFKFKREASIHDFVDWCSERVFPENRIGVKELLKDMGLERYDGWEIAKQTHASLVTDPYWISFSDCDKYEKCTIRGLLGDAPSGF